MRLHAAASSKRPAGPDSIPPIPGALRRDPHAGPDAGADTAGPLAPRPSAWPALAVYAAAFFLALLSSTLLVLVVAFIQTGGQRSRLQAAAYDFTLSPPGLMAGAFVNAAVLSAVAFVAARRRGESVRAALRLGPSQASPLGLIAAAAGLVGLNFASGAASELLRVRGAGVMDTLARALEAPTVGRFAAAILAIAVAPGFAEETFFRGFLQARLGASWGRWPAIVATAAAFALIHLDPVQSSLVFLAGLFLGWVAERLGSVRPSILAHVTNNAVFVGLSAFASATPGPWKTQIAIVVAGASCWVAAVLALRSSRALVAAGR